MFGKLPRTLVMSEPGALGHIHRLYNQKSFTWDEYERLIKTCVKLQFKPTRQTVTDRYDFSKQIRYNSFHEFVLSLGVYQNCH